MTGEELIQFLSGCGTECLEEKDVIVEMPDDQSRYAVEGVYYDKDNIVIQIS